ncbi:hypothetical protein D1B33_07545 [Lysinibacillus yapensis]|uniref:Uncharacterized protein n=1 Tax=Ureibacillus yapensis TaxID=2304605 RepID=A0A396SBG8_9BACL|nr:hypothetical protein [Lysinibacillus yapensis]RHW38718.1 hypothetical protein D1B33_07545 [Lysinibacillus yapensis]
METFVKVLRLSLDHPIMSIMLHCVFLIALLQLFNKYIELNYTEKDGVFQRKNTEIPKSITSFMAKIIKIALSLALIYGAYNLAVFAPLLLFNKISGENGGKKEHYRYYPGKEYEADDPGAEDDYPGYHYVDDYYRSDGTHVESHFRSNPDGNPDNNLNSN